MYRKKIVLHRIDGPALVHDPKKEYNNFTQKEWWINGERHRLNKPAYSFHHYSKNYEINIWYRKGKLYRLDGPAFESYDKMFTDYFINDKKLNKKEVEGWINNNNINLKTKEHQALFMLRFG